MYEGFRHFDIQTSDPQVTIRGVVGGSGPPLLLLHGNPLTHIHWRLVAPRLAEDFTVVATDLRGYGESGKPRGLPDHSNYSFRRMAQDQVDVMRDLGFERFMVARHDRGARTPASLSSRETTILFCVSEHERYGLSRFAPCVWSAPARLSESSV